MTENKTLDEYINGRVTDVVYLPTDVQAVYEFGKIMDITSSGQHESMSPEEFSATAKSMKEIIERTKTTADKVTIRDLKWKQKNKLEEEQDAYKYEQKKLAREEEGFDEERWEETFLPPFDKMLQNTLAVASIVSVEFHDGEVVHSWEKDEEYWFAWLEKLMDEQHQTYERLLIAIRRIQIEAATEEALMRNIDFLS